MKNLFFVLVFTFGSLALSCPDIEGKFKQTFPVNSGAELLISSEIQDGNKVFHLTMPALVGPTWAWQSIVTETPQPKNMGAFYKNVYEVAVCKERQLYVKTYGEVIDGDKTISFHQEWFLFRSTMGDLRWQINYMDDTLTEPRVSIFGYEDVRPE